MHEGANKLIAGIPTNLNLSGRILNLWLIDFSVPQNEEGEVEPFIAQQTGGKGKVKRRADRFLEVLL